MADGSPIEWTDATWNPTVGCTVVSPGCTNCYAMKVANGLERRFDSEKYRGLTKVVNKKAVWTGEVRLDESALLQPLKWKRGRRIFVNSMSDLFHESLSDADIDRVLAVMALCPQHTFQVLTKRAERMREYCGDLAAQRRIYELVCDMVTEDCVADVVLVAPFHDPNCAPEGTRIYLDQWPLPNVWLGVSAERQQEADERIPHLMATPAAVRFLSAEPLLGPIKISYLEWARLDWVIAGGESGSNARPMHPDWVRSLRDQCKAAGIPFFFKQWGEWAAADKTDDGFINAATGERGLAALWGQETHSADKAFFAKVGKKAAGRLLDGVTHDGFPA